MKKLLKNKYFAQKLSLSLLPYDFLKNPYARLMRLHQPIGYLLLFMPICWTVAIASTGAVQMLFWSFFFLLASILMRSIGCIINDMVDSDIDSMVERTKIRPIASGEVSMFRASILLLILCSLAFLFLIMLPKSIFYMGIAAFFMLSFYPFAKRFSHFAQIFLGLTFNLGIFIAWFTIKDAFSWAPVLIYIAAVLWTVAYDTIYAYQDIEYDRKLGLKSMAIKLGENGGDVVWTLYRTLLVVLCIAAVGLHMNFMFYICIGAITYAVYYVIERINLSNPEDCKDAFHSNYLFGIAVLLSILLGKF